MRTKGLIIIFLLLCSATLFSQITPFKDWHKNGLIGTTYITKNMLELASNLEIGELRIKNLDETLEQVEMYTNATSESTTHIAGFAMQAMAVEIAESYNYELLLRMNQPKEDIAFYAKRKNNNDALIADLIMITTIPDVKLDKKCTVVRLVGQFLAEDIYKIR